MSRFCQPNRLRVLVDIDQVLADFESAFLDRFREKYPEEPYIQLDERKGFYVRDQYEKLKPKSPEFTAKICSVFNEEGFFYGLPEIEGACAAVKEMVQMDGVDVFLCSTPLLGDGFKYSLKEKYQWVEEHLGVEWLDRIILSKDKTVINGHLIIDDRPFLKGACQNPTWEHVVFSSCHNLTTNVRGKRRLDNWTNGDWRELIEDFKKRI